MRLLSDGGLRVALADERNEVAAQWEGEAQFDVGERTDVLSGAPKAEAALLLLRAMNPQVLPWTRSRRRRTSAPARSRRTAGCGCSPPRTARGSGDLRTRPLYRELLALDLFRRAIVIRGRGTDRYYRQEWL